jgi:hypothetical protein
VQLVPTVSEQVPVVVQHAPPQKLVPVQELTPAMNTWPATMHPPVVVVVQVVPVQQTPVWAVATDVTESAAMPQHSAAAQRPKCLIMSMVSCNSPGLLW